MVSDAFLTRHLEIYSTAIILFFCGQAPSIAKENSKSVPSISMPVFYATNRMRTTARHTPVYSKQRRTLPGLEYGECQVTISGKDVDFDERRDIALGWHKKTKKVRKVEVDKQKSQSSTEKSFFEELNRRAKDRDRVILFVHGYKSTLDGALAIGARLESVFHAPVVIFSWPSSQQYRGYMKDECNIEWSLPHFKRLLAKMEENVGADKLVLVAHSMGNRLAVWSLRDRAELALCQKRTNSKFPDVVLTSPDIDTGTFKNYAEDVCSNAEETWVLTSSKDNALRASKFLHKRRRLGMPGPDGVDIYWGQPPEVKGMRTIEFSAIDKGLVGHSIQHSLIYNLSKDGKPGVGLRLKDREQDDYKWEQVEVVKN
ncbi:MAG: alpha/beta hydrolase [Candidatus Obscuribacterales bacterium]|nr:alpha/beta hydrolase [Candidatus Obscuribacterales bacterium]